jgi:hypothetical protein
MVNYNAMEEDDADQDEEDAWQRRLKDAWGRLWVHVTI